MQRAGFDTPYFVIRRFYFRCTALSLSNIIDGAQTTERNQFPIRFMFAQAQHHFVLYSRSYCHLCDDMAQALQVLGIEYSFTLEIIDVDTDEGLIAQFDELVPVLFGRKNGKDAIRLCHYFFNEQAVRSFLASE